MTKFSLEIMEPNVKTTNRPTPSKGWKHSSLNLELNTQAKQTWRMEVKHRQTKIKEFLRNISRPYLIMIKEIIKHVLQSEGKWPYIKAWSCKRSNKKLNIYRYINEYFLYKNQQLLLLLCFLWFKMYTELKHRTMVHKLIAS